MEVRLGRRSRPREFLAEPVEQAARIRSEAPFEVRHGRLHRARPDGRLVAGDEQVADLVEQPERADLAGLDRRRAGVPCPVHPAGEAADAGRVGHDEVAVGPDQRPVDPVELACLAPHVEGAEIAHRGSIARPPAGHAAPTGAQTPATSAGRDAAT